MNALQPHQQRVVDEKNEVDQQNAVLASRLFNLDTFINGGSVVFGRLPDLERDRLRDQQYAMTRALFHSREYVRILGERIAAFTGV